MGHADDEDEQLAVLDLADEAVVVHPPAPQAVLVASERLAKAPGIAPMCVLNTVIGLSGV